MRKFCIRRTVLSADPEDQLIGGDVWSLVAKFLENSTRRCCPICCRFAPATEIRCKSTLESFVETNVTFLGLPENLIIKKQLKKF
jgi:hypothetical protein